MTIVRLRHWRGLFVLFAVILICLTKGHECAKLLSYGDSPIIQKCQSEYVYDEDKQDCVQPTKREDFECLLTSRFPFGYVNDEYENEMSNKEASTAPTKKIFLTPTSKKLLITKSNSINEKKANKNTVSKANKLILSKMLDKSNATTKSAGITSKSLSSNKATNKRNFFSRNLKEDGSIENENNKEDEVSEVEEVEEEDKLKANSKSATMEKTNNNKVESEPAGLDKNDENDSNEPEYRRMCIVTNWSQFRTGKAKFMYDYINIHLCNHIIFSSVVISEYDDEEDEHDGIFIIKSVQHNDFDLYSKLSSFKKIKEDLKLILRITDDNGRLYSKLSRKPETRAKFIENCLEFIETHDFDGIEIDWKWPCGAAGNPNDKQNFALLLKEFKSKFDSKYLLGMTMSPLNDRIQAAYSLLDINNNVDFVEVEAYDYYGPWDKRTGLNSPLMKMDEQYLFEAFMNIDGTITFLKALGLGANKIVLGLAAYGRSYVLSDSKQTNINAPTSGNGFSGSYTKINGLLSYYEICESQKHGSWKEEWKELAMVPYMYNDENEWVSFENEESLRKKIEYVKTNGLAGVSVNSIDMDDFQGSFCNQGPYPFLKFTLNLLLKAKDRKLLAAQELRKAQKQKLKRKETTTKSSTFQPTTTSTSTLISRKKSTKQILEKKISLKPKINTIKMKTTQREVESTMNEPTIKSTKQNKITEKTTRTMEQAEQEHLGIQTTIARNQPRIMSTSSTKSKKLSIAFFLITPPPNSIKKKEKSYKQLQMEQKYQQELVERMNRNQQQIIRQKTEVLPKDVEINVQAPTIKTLLVTPPSNLFQATKQQLNFQSLNFDFNYQQHEFELKQRQQLELMEQQRKQSQQLEIQQEQLRKQIREQEWQLQQQKHQQQENWIKNLQLQQQKQNEQMHLQQQQQNQIYQNQYVNAYNPTPPTLPPFTYASSTHFNNLMQQPLPSYYSSGQSNTWSSSNNNFAQENKCLNKRNGIYRDEYQCDSFYVCEVVSAESNVAPRIHKFKCPPGLIYSMKECTCDWPSADANPCITPIFNSFCKETGPDEAQKNRFALLTSTVLPTEKSLVITTPTISATTPTTYYNWNSAFSCSNKEKGLHRDVYDCSKFYYCQIINLNGQGGGFVIRHDFVCPNGLSFNLENCQCDWPSENGCNQNIYSTFCVGSSHY